MRRRTWSSDLITKINMTPLIDVALVLVTILLVTAPMLSIADLAVNLPAAHTRGVEDERNISITRAANGDLAIDKRRIGSDALRPMLAALLAQPGNKDVLVVIRADTSIPYGEIRDLLDQARQAGARRLAVATRQATEDKP